MHYESGDRACLQLAVSVGEGYLSQKNCRIHAMEGMLCLSRFQNSRIAAACYPPYITQDFDFVYTISLNNSTRSESDADHNEFLLSMKRNLV